MDNFIYSVPNYIVDWSKYIDMNNSYSDQCDNRHIYADNDDVVAAKLKKELYAFLNIPESESGSYSNPTILCINITNKKNHNLLQLNKTTKNTNHSSKFSQKNRSKNRH